MKRSCSSESTACPGRCCTIHTLSSRRGTHDGRLEREKKGKECPTTCATRSWPSPSRRCWSPPPAPSICPAWLRRITRGCVGDAIFFFSSPPRAKTLASKPLTRRMTESERVKMAQSSFDCFGRSLRYAGAQVTHLPLPIPRLSLSHPPARRAVPRAG